MSAPAPDAPYRRKLIEVDLPLATINAESAREKSLRHGHPSTLHLWWARRPLAACRAVVFASMVDDPGDVPDEFPTEADQRKERKRLHELIERLVVWENSADETLLAQARHEIARSVARARGHDAPDKDDRAAVLAYLKEHAPPVVDPFCGGGSIPLEAQRLGLSAVGTDLNPVAVLITKALIELPPKFRGQPPVNPDADPMKRGGWKGAAGLADDIRWYGRWMRERAFERIGHLYPKATLPDGTEATVIAWLWARTVPCPNPACGVAMPLKKMFQLSKKKGNEHWTRPTYDRDANAITFTVQDHTEGVPLSGTVDRNGAVCLACGAVAPLAYVREQGRAGRIGEQMVGIVAEGDRRRLFLSPTDEHGRVANAATPRWRPSAKLPDRALGFAVQAYGYKEWSQLFTERQLTTLTTFSDLLEDARARLVEDSGSSEYANTIATYLTLAIGRASNGGSSWSVWDISRDIVTQVFAIHAISMKWDFPEANPFSESTQNWLGQIEWVARSVERLSVPTNTGEARQANASTTIPAGSPIIVTDPPYYDNIGFADLSDFFYTWIRPALRDIYPDLFSGISVPKSEEMTASPRFESPREHFESSMASALILMRQHCTQEFPSSIFYAYKQQEEIRDGVASTGWDTMLTALVEAGFQISGTWPVRTERPNRPRSLDSNTLATSVVLVCRPRPEDAPLATRREFLDALAAELPGALEQLTHEGHIAPVDLAQAAIGPGMKVYSRYRRVETIGGEPVTVRDALMAINAEVARYHEREEGALDGASRFCAGWLRQHGYDAGAYGEAETLARTLNVTVEGLSPRLLEAVGGKVRLLRPEAYAHDGQAPLAGLTAWEGAFRMAWHLWHERGAGTAGAAAVARGMGSGAAAAERLARILYEHFDRKGDSANAVRCNGLVTAWPEIEQARLGAEQAGLGLGG